jgi:hypothetical protein
MKLRSSKKAEFVRQHPGLPSREVVRLATQHGLKMSMKYVQNNRNLDRRALGTTLREPTEYKPDPRVNKADWIRAHPDVPARALLREARRQGLRLTEAYVVLVRAYQEYTVQQDPVAPPVVQQALEQMVVNYGLDWVRRVISEYHA